MPLNSAQKQAVEYLDGPLLVLAGPGTGKTQLLSAKVAYILENTDTNPENILCVTFTESGASNMRQRLLSMIGQSAYQVNIFTYHSFGSNLLFKYKNYATEFKRNLDEPISDVVKFRIIKNILKTLPASDILRPKNFSDQTAIRDIIDTIAKAKDYNLTTSDLTKIAKQNLKDTEKINQDISPILKNLTPRMKYPDALEKVYLPLLEVLAKYSSNQPITLDIEREANEYVRTLNSIIESENVKAKPSISPLTKWKNKYTEQTADGNFRLSNLIANKKLLSLASIVEKYSQILEDSGFFDFSDMIQEAIHILKTDQGFRLTISERFQYILLDEFQDTNPSQFELIKLLTDYESPSVMAVGDDDQAIYAFQGASASNLLDFQTHYQAKVITLTENYRSTQEILDFSSRIAEQIESRFSKKANLSKILTSIRNNDILKTGKVLRSGPSYISRHEFLASDSEYHWVASQISDLIKKGEQQSSIAIITPKHKYIEPLLPYLKQYEEIKINYEKRENILEDPKIKQIALLSKAIFALSQSQPIHEYLLEILSFPFWQIEPTDIIQLSQVSYEQRSDFFTVLFNSTNQNIQNFTKILSILALSSLDLPLELFFNQLIGVEKIQSTETISSPFLDFYTAHDSDFSTFKLYENLSVLKESIKSHIKSEKPLLKDFIDFLNDYEDAGQAILSTSPYQESTNAVQILTAHKSKGLEFRHVFLVSVDNLSWGNAKGNNNQLTLPNNLTKIRHTGNTDDEKLRLFFVAITRAEKSLTLTNSIQDYSGKSPDRLKYLSEHEATSESSKYLASPFIPNGIITSHNDELDASEKLKNLQASWLSTYQDLHPDLKTILLKNLENYRLSATDLTTFIDIIYAGPLEFYKTKILRAPTSTFNESISLGNILHSVFEAITSHGISNQEAIELFKQKVQLEPAPPSDLVILEERGISSLTASLDTFQNILRHPDSKAEINLKKDQINFEGIPLTGKIDHINIDKEHQTIEIYDFKTGNYHKENWHAHPTLFKYSLQLEFYKLLLNLSPEFKKYRITTGHILFTTPTQPDNIVYDKVYNFSDSSAKELQVLIKSIHHHITNLTFLEEDSPLSIYPDSTRNLRDIKNFIELIISNH